jgi:Flp pilus assembly protein TadD
MAFYKPSTTGRAGRVAVLTLACLAAVSLAAQEPASESAPEPTVVDRALSHLDAGDVVAAITALEGAPAEDPRAMSLLGALYLDGGRAEDAWGILGPIAEGPGKDQPAVLYNAGRAALATSRIDDAERLLARSVDLEAGTPASRELGMLRGAQGAFGAAYPLLRPWALANPDDSEARLAAAVGALELHRLSEAEELLSDLDQQQPIVRATWARLLLSQQDAVGAFAMLEPLLTPLAEASWEVRSMAADAQLAMAQPEEALALLEGRNPQDPLAGLQATRALYQDGRVEEALAAISPFADIALAADPETLPADRRSIVGRVSLEMGRILAAQGEYSQGLPFLKKATLFAPEQPEGWRLLGRALAATERREDADAAIEEYQAVAERIAADREARELDPVAAAIAEAQDLIASGRFDDALQLMGREIDINPGDARPRLLQGAIFLNTGRSADAVKSANAAIAVAGPSADAYYLRGAARLASSSLEAAENDLQAALEQVPDHVPAMNDLAVVMIRSGRTDPARELLYRVLELVPTHEVARENLDKIGG